MTSQTERITILCTPEFKDWLFEEAKQEGLSVSELVHRRCQAVSSQDEELLSVLIDEVRRSTKKASKTLDRALKTADEVFAEIRTRKKGQPNSWSQ